ncbi:MAG: stage II sporulation protein R [Oscillospiraceae bacterium]|nr:stage II sporulation protein R [Oscillospiraceae bacterium]
MAQYAKEALMRLLTAALLIIFMISFTVAADFGRGCRELREDMLRLHILAQSDLPEDQALKLAVRDRLLERSADWAAASGEKEQMMLYLSENLDDIEAAAEETLLENGCDLPVKAELSHSFFDTRVYEERTVPAGWYDTLRVTIGEGKGKNWWCVLYPPLCLPAAEGEAILDNSFTDEEKAVLSSPQRYQIRFLTVELIEKFLNWLRS